MIPAKKRRQIRFLLREGLSQGEVAKRAGVSIGTVSRIAKLLKEQQDLSSELKKISPCLICHVSEVPELIRIINDLQELHKLQLISHPLFGELARRARRSLRKISLGSM